MSEVIDQAVAALAEKLGDERLDGTVRFDIEGEGSVMVDATGVHAGEGEADVTLSADADTFREIMAGELNATAAFMGGKLKVDGDMGLAMKLGSVLA